MPIRLGEGRKPLGSLESRPAAESHIPGPTAVDRILSPDSWSRLPRGLHFSHIEQRLFELHWRKGVPRHRLASELGITPRAAISAYESVANKLRSPRAASCVGVDLVSHSRSLSYREQIRPGMYSWALAPLPDSFLEIMNAEKLNLLCFERDGREIQKKRIFCPRIVGGQMKSLSELSEQLKAERAKHERLSERVHASRVGAEEAASDVDRIERELATGQAEAAFEEKEWPPEALTKKLAAARAKVSGTEATLAAARAALEKQAGIVEGIEAEISGRRREALLTAIAGPRREFLAAVRTAIDKAHVFDRAIAENGPAYETDVFPTSRPSDPESDFWDRRRMMVLLAELIKIDWSRAGYTGEDNIPYHRRKVG